MLAPSQEAEKKVRLFGCYDRRYLIELIPSMVLLLAAAAIALWVPRTPGVRLLMVGLASISVAYCVVVTVAAVRRLDELQQRIHLIAIAVSFAVAGVVLAFSRFLELAGVKQVPTGMGLWMVMFLVWCIAVVVLSRRYR